MGYFGSGIIINRCRRKYFESGTHGAGSALSADLEPGMYYIKEVFTNNEDHDLYEENNEWAGDHWYPYGGEWSKPFRIDKGTETIVDFYNYQIVAPGHKTASIGDTPLSGAVFVAFATEKAATEF